MKNKSNSILLIIGSIITTVPTFSCMITFINDSSNTIAILNHNDEYNQNNPSNVPDNFIIINKGKQRRFNKADEHAHFSVYIMGRGSLTVAYEVMQYECGNNGNPQITFSELKNNTIDHSLFTLIDRNRIHTSMVNQLPLIQTAAAVNAHEASQNGCISCYNK